MAKIMTITLGGTERRLDVGKFIFNYHLEDYLKGKEALTFDYSCAIIYAGMMAECEVNKSTPDFTKEQVREWVAMEDSDVISDFMGKYAEITKKPGE